MEFIFFCLSISLIWINWKIYDVSKALLDVSEEVLEETVKMNTLLGADFDKMDNWCIIVLHYSPE